MIELEINEENLFNFIKNIRQQDYQELEYFLKDNIEKKFVETCVFDKGKIYLLGDKNKNPLAIGGLSEKNFEKKVGQVWLLYSNFAINNKKDLMKYIKSKIQIFKNHYDILYNFIYKSNFEALKWLENYGFNVYDLKNYDFKLFYFLKGGINFDIRYFTG